MNGKSLRRTAAVLLVVLAGLTATMLLLPHRRIPEHAHHRSILSRAVLPADTADAARAAHGVFPRRAALLTVPVIAAPLLVLVRLRRTVFGPTPVRRRKLPVGDMQPSAPGH